MIVSIRKLVTVRGDSFKPSAYHHKPLFHIFIINKTDNIYKRSHHQKIPYRFENKSEFKISQRPIRRLD